MDSETLLKKAKEFDYWYYPYDLGDGKEIRATEERHNTFHKKRLKYELLKAIKIICGGNLHGLRVLDCGCNSGFFSFKCAELGAEYVLGLEGKDIFIEQANLLNSYFKFPNIEFKKMDVSNITLDKIGQFDIVILMGIITYLKNAPAFLDEISKITKKYIIVESLASPFDTPLFHLRSDNSNKPTGGLFPHTHCLIPSWGMLKTLFSINGLKAFRILNCNKIIEDFKYKTMIALIMSKEQKRGFTQLVYEEAVTDYEMLKYELTSLRKHFKIKLKSKLASLRNYGKKSK